jgi:hypothetical protein
VAQRELGGRERARRGAGDGQAVDAQMVEELDEDVGLVQGRGVVRKGASEIAEARGSDDAKSL